MDTTQATRTPADEARDVVLERLRTESYWADVNAGEQRDMAAGADGKSREDRLRGADIYEAIHDWYARLAELVETGAVPLVHARIARHNDERTLIALDDGDDAFRIKVTSALSAHRLMSVVTDVAVARESVERRTERSA